ncbi:hypothetical protein [Natronococcus sp. A-GB7]|uniref:hypothetical protein n=1 Tax=Natronococcus sp. A-GB7 TaxID=3037649 RepID=UPI00241F4233|nr:hypothetical protein [Natronococcus sp. A-GB7]MDG5820970.1 hypothetical protein [Natronococcus sp. A-GB7]
MQHHATDDVRDYVDSDTFAKYLETLEKRYLVAIGTDGLRWVLRAKDVHTGETKRDLATVDLSDAIKSVAKGNDIIEGEPAHSTSEIRQFVADEFLPSFAAHSVDEFVSSTFND